MVAAIASLGPVPIGELVPVVARCWQAARHAGACTQQRLHKLLLPRGCEMLSPVFDSLMALYEGALGRPLALGDAATVSRDERLLVAMLDGSCSRRSCVDCAEGAARLLDCSLCSTRIMLALAIDCRPGGRS